ncbi:MAG: VWA domain-containing protein [Planctomycetes bacterium]|nr:VWA domain-containing protein [Planctomycetota bacterium]
MSFAHPQLLWGLAALGLVPLLYLVRRRSRRAPVPHLFLWERALASQGHSRRRRIHDFLGLVLNLLLVACLVLAAAGPRRDRRVRAARPALVVLDASLSMAARATTTGSRFDQARAEAATRLPALLAEGPVGLLAAAGSPIWLAGLGADREDLERGLDEVIELRGRLDTEALLEFVGRARVREATLRVILVSDGAFLGDREALVAAGIELVRVGGAEGNAALVGGRLLTRRGADFEVAVDLAVSGRALTGRVLLEVPEGEGSAVDFTLAGGESREFRLGGRMAEAGLVTVRLVVEGDALAADDRLELAIDRDPRLRVLVVAGETGAHLEAALAALDEVFDVERSGRSAPEDWRRADLAAFDLVILRGVDEKSSLPPARYLLIDSFAPGLGLKAGAVLDHPAILRQETRPRLLRALDLRDLEVTRARGLRVTAAVDVLLEADGGPLIVQGEDYLLLAFDVDEASSSLVLLPAFPLLLKDAARELVPLPERLLPPVAAAGRLGELLRPLADGVPIFEVGAEGDPVGSSLRRGADRFLAPARLGDARLVLGDRQEQVGLAVLDRRASDLEASITTLAPEPGPPAQRRREQDLVPFALAAALALALLEWLLFSRGWTR